MRSPSWKEPRRLTPETLIKRDIKRYLSLTGWFCFPILQGLGAWKGIPDIIACKGGQVLFIEVKAPKGKQNPYQQEFEMRIKEAGCIYLLIRDITELMDFGKKSNYALKHIETLVEPAKRLAKALNDPPKIN